MIIEVKIPGNGYREAEVMVSVWVAVYPHQGWHLSLWDFERAIKALTEADGPKVLYTNVRPPDWGQATCDRWGISLLQGPSHEPGKDLYELVAESVKRTFA